MAVLHDYSCMAHGRFESMTGKCPHGCAESFVRKVFLKAPGFRSNRTTNIDRTLQNLASDYGLTDLNNRGGTDAVKRPDPRKTAENGRLMDMLHQTSPFWGEIQNGSGGIQKAVSAIGAMSQDNLSSVKPVLNAPKPMVVARDNSKIDTNLAPS